MLLKIIDILSYTLTMVSNCTRKERKAGISSDLVSMVNKNSTFATCESRASAAPYP